MTRFLGTLAAASLIVAIGACGGDDDSDAATDPEPAAAGDDNGAGGDGEADAGADDDGAGDDDGGAGEPAAASGSGSATLTLDNGETFEFSVLCNLESQMAAGSEILFTAVSYDTPSLDITQFGNEGTVTDLASVTVSDDSYETLWEANTTYEAFGGSLELSVDGSTIRGTGSFFPGADIAATPVDGEVVANC